MTPVEPAGSLAVSRLFASPPTSYSLQLIALPQVSGLRFQAFFPMRCACNLASYFISSVQGREQLNPLRIEMPTWITGETFITAEVIRELHESYFAGKPAVRALINRMKNTASRSAAASVLIQAARSAKLDEAAKKRWAVELISTIVPQEEAPYTSCLTEILAAQPGQMRIPVTCPAPVRPRTTLRSSAPTNGRKPPVRNPSALGGGRPARLNRRKALGICDARVLVGRVSIVVHAPACTVQARMPAPHHIRPLYSCSASTMAK